MEEKIRERKRSEEARCLVNVMTRETDIVWIGGEGNTRREEGSL